MIAYLDDFFKKSCFNFLQKTNYINIDFFIEKVAMSCQYSDALGVPGEGVHEARLGPFALWDTVATLCVALFLTYLLGGSLKGFALASIIILTLAIILHWVFCVDTASGRILGLV
jgi:hypothetical protein